MTIICNASNLDHLYASRDSLRAELESAERCDPRFERYHALDHAIKTYLGMNLQGKSHDPWDFKA